MGDEKTKEKEKQEKKNMIKVTQKEETKAVTKNGKHEFDIDGVNEEKDENNDGKNEKKAETKNGKHEFDIDDVKKENDENNDEPPCPTGECGKDKNNAASSFILARSGIPE